MTLKILIIIIVLSLFLAFITFSIRVIIKVHKIVKEFIYSGYIKYIKDFLLDVQDRIIKIRKNNQNTALINFDNGKDILLLYYSGIPGVDTDGEVFVYLGIMPIGKTFTFKEVDPIFILDTIENKTYYKYTRSRQKRIKKLYKLLSSESKVSINLSWSQEIKSNQDKIREFILSNIERIL